MDAEAGNAVARPGLTVIEASAGTGKTFSLVTRLLDLIFSGTEPERIVALTFSRMAAGEIFNSFVERLSGAAESDAAASDEAARLGRRLAKHDFAAMLRKVISRQHLSLIGTLDSFLVRIVRMMPLELGLGGEMKIMGDYQAPVERERLLGKILTMRGEDAAAVFREAFSLAFGEIGSKGFLEGFAAFVDAWHEAYRDRPDPAAWGVAETVWGDAPPPGLGEATISAVRGMAGAFASEIERPGVASFAAALASFAGAVPKIPKALERNPAARRAAALARAWKIADALRATRGVHRLMFAYESFYAAGVRSRGRVTFEDLPRLLDALGDGVRLPLEYRMDARFDHWALDEFQDTSRGQWKALSNLMEECRQSPEARSVLIVGDRKQSIYEWRGGDVRILSEQAAKADLVVPLDESRRYLPAISAAVNRVFAEDVVRGVFDMDAASDAAVWRCNEHTSHDKSNEGFVEVVEAVKAGRTASAEDFFAPVENAIMAVKPWEKGISAAVLVRNNRFGEAIHAYLKSRGVENVVFEGESAISDSPVLSAMAELVALAEHSNDAFAYAHLAASPLADALYPGGLPPPGELSASLLSDFARLGMARKFREAREALKKIPGTWNDFTEARFADFMKCAAEFEAMRDQTMRLADFTEYFRNRRRRDYAEAGMVRIMTMHQSKGLGFDHVIIPFYERDGLFGSSRHRAALESEKPSWILADPGADAAASDPVLAAAEKRRRDANLYASLCLDYVAMTRAKKALTLILHPRNKKEPETPERFSDLVRRVGFATMGDKAWHLAIPKKPLAAPEPEPPHVVREKRREVGKSRPSEAFLSGLRGDALFADDFGAAAERGVEVHAKYEGVEWLDAAAAKTPLERALVKPSPDATLWRERAYELFVDGVWESGRFDRVVFTGEGASRKAAIYDFKTNAIHAGETREAFARRLAAAYAPQMASYRRALSALTGIPPTSITTTLLATAVLLPVPVGFGRPGEEEEDHADDGEAADGEERRVPAEVLADERDAEA